MRHRKYVTINEGVTPARASGKGKDGTVGLHTYQRREILQMLTASSVTFVVAACSNRPVPQERSTINATTTSPLEPATVARQIVATDTPPALSTPTPNVWRPPAAPHITTNEEFYTMKYHPNAPPTVDPDDFQLTIDGEVDNPLSLSLEQLREFPAFNEMRTLECISNPVGGKLIGNAVWTGISLSQLLQEVGIRPVGKFLRLDSLDGYHTGIPLELAMAEHSLLVYEMNGKRLPAKHGYPLRALFPGRYGQKQPKWLNAIKIQRQPHIGHFEGQGWSDDAVIKPNSRIEQPPPRQLQSGSFFVAGIAFTTDVGLEKVEVSLDDGNHWQEAELLAAPSPRVWTHWWLEVDGLEPGTHRAVARVTDRAGKTQTRPGRHSNLLNNTFPDGTDEMHRMVIQVSSGTGE